MKFKVPEMKTIDVKYVFIIAPVRYGEEDMPNDFHGRTGDVWRVLIDIETGQIQGYNSGEFDLSMKVCDSGIYQLLDANHQAVASLDQEYVPHGVVCGRYGDYIEFDISETGVIRNWPKTPNIKEFFHEV